MYMTGGDNEPRPYDPKGLATDSDVVAVSSILTKTQSLGAVLFQIPNQPITFADDATPWRKDRREVSGASYLWSTLLLSLSLSLSHICYVIHLHMQSCCFQTAGGTLLTQATSGLLHTNR